MTKPVPTFVKGCGGVAGSFSPFIGGAVDGFTQYFTTDDGVYDSGFYIKDDTLVMQVSTASTRQRDMNRANECHVRLKWSTIVKSHKRSSYRWMSNTCQAKSETTLCSLLLLLLVNYFSFMGSN